MRNPREISYNVRFTDSCRYDLGDENQLDINKLFGIGYFPSHRHNSMRFGWTYSRERDVIQLWAYWYANGKRTYTHLQNVNIGQLVGLKITTTMINIKHRVTTGHGLFINGEQKIWVPGIRQTKWAYLLRPYFGGDRVAPHDMWIEMYRYK